MCGVTDGVGDDGVCECGLSISPVLMFVVVSCIEISR